MGTATTIGVISEGRTYEGGLLLPGVNVSLEALSRRAAQLPAISLQAPKNLIGKSTEDCMRSGIVYGTAAMLDGIIDRIRGEFPGKELHIVATGLAEQPLEFGDVDEPGAVELQLVFDRVDAFTPCNRLDQRIAWFGCQHRVAGVAK